MSKLRLRIFRMLRLSLNETKKGEGSQNRDSSRLKHFENAKTEIHGDSQIWRKFRPRPIKIHQKVLKLRLRVLLLTVLHPLRQINRDLYPNMNFIPSYHALTLTELYIKLPCLKQHCIFSYPVLTGTVYQATLS